jgi:hypothetical protein
MSLDQRHFVLLYVDSRKRPVEPLGLRRSELCIESLIFLRQTAARKTNATVRSQPSCPVFYISDREIVQQSSMLTLDKGR